jgi:hypothetical protein
MGGDGGVSRVIPPQLYETPPLAFWPKPSPPPYMAACCARCESAKEVPRNNLAASVRFAKSFLVKVFFSFHWLDWCGAVLEKCGVDGLGGRSPHTTGTTHHHHDRRLPKIKVESPATSSFPPT